MHSLASLSIYPFSGHQYTGIISYFFVCFFANQWRIIAGGTKCIPKSELPVEDDDPQSQPAAPPSSRLWLHPSDLSIALSASTPLYPPGRIIHVVHNHPPETWWEKPFEKRHPKASHSLVVQGWLQRVDNTLVFSGVFFFLFPLQELNEWIMETIT